MHIPDPHEDTEGDALLRLIRHVSETGQRGTAFDFAGNQIKWKVEADTKVDDNDEWFPVIVHRQVP